MCLEILRSIFYLLSFSSSSVCFPPPCWRAEDEKLPLFFFFTFLLKIHFPLYFLLTFTFSAAFLLLSSHYLIFFPLLFVRFSFPFDALYFIPPPITLFSLFLSPFLSFTFTVNLSLRVSFALPLTACQRLQLKHLSKSKWDSALFSMSFVELKVLLVGSELRANDTPYLIFF